MHTHPLVVTIASVAAALAVVFAVAWAAATHGATVVGVPIVLICAGLAIGVQWVAFVPAFLKRTERYYDLVGSLTYLSVIAFATLAGGRFDGRSMLLAGLVTVWAARLGSFLFRRISAAGSDPRFDEIKSSGSSFFLAWTLQGVWVFVTLCAALAAITSLEAAPMGARDGVGLAIWLMGFGIEVVADRQKGAHRKTQDGQFIQSGLWAWSRHPNYFGEIVLWVGIAVVASSSLSGFQWVTMISPLFVTLLLTRISGIPLLEARADKRWGGQAAYERYKARTPVLIPRPPRS